MNQHGEQRPAGTDGSASRAQVPTRLVESPKARYAWLLGFAGFGIGAIVIGIASARSPGDRWAPVIMSGLGVGLIALGAVALRWGIVADREGVAITNLRRRTIPWTELEDVLLVKVESDIDLGFHHLLFLTRTGDAVRPAAPTGWNRPGRKLPRLQGELLAMRDFYASGVRADAGGPLGGE
jgi:hypothetical protein